MNRRGFLLGLMSTAAVGAIACAVAAPAMAVSEPMSEPVAAPWPVDGADVWEYDTTHMKFVITYKIPNDAFVQRLADYALALAS